MTAQILASAVIAMLAFTPMAVPPASAQQSAAPRQGGAATKVATDAAPAAAVAAAYVPDLAPLVNQSASEMRDVIERFSDDRAALARRYDAAFSPARREQFREFYTAWQERLAGINFEKLSLEGRVDYILLRGRLGYDLDVLKREEKLIAETQPLLPFAGIIIDLQDARRRMETVNPAAAAAQLAKLAAEVEKTRRAVEAGAAPARGGPGAATPPATTGQAAVTPIKPTRPVAWRSSEMLEALRRQLEGWFRYYNGYDPMFTWWAEAPHKKADAEMQAYLRVLRERVLGIRQGEEEPIFGRPVGREELLFDLQYEMIPYTPEQLIAIAEREFSWCETEMKKAAKELGFGDDWKAALEKVKTLHADPGKQPDIVRDLAREAIDFVTQRNLLTVPPLARDVWRIEMMSPERQRENPFFLGGETIQVSFPTDTMSHEDKLMSMRGNNIHFSRATVHHELIPGHHLQGFMTSRYNSHRGMFGGPFWGEGWALWWEMLLWDLGFPKTPEDRVGFLFWRMHRCARIIFSLKFHLGEMTPEQCVDFLVERVGHERANAAGEVRRSFRGNYPPLYQLAYMMGALQFRALHTELVKSGKMTNAQFHDAILQGGRMPVEMVRARLTKQSLARDFTSSWKFAGEIPAK
jgi:uncharacterized protein (DUF885 family)